MLPIIVVKWPITIRWIIFKNSKLRPLIVYKSKQIRFKFGVYYYYYYFKYASNSKCIYVVRISDYISAIKYSIKWPKFNKGGSSFKTLNCNPLTDLSNIPQTLYLSYDIKVIYSKTTCGEVRQCLTTLNSKTHKLGSCCAGSLKARSLRSKYTYHKLHLSETYCLHFAAARLKEAGLSSSQLLRMKRWL